MFLIKKLVAPTLFPLSVVVLLLIVGIGLLWFSQRQKIGKVLVSLALLLLLAFSYSWVIPPALKHLEREYPAINDLSTISGVKWIVVLGGGTSSDNGIPLAARLSEASLARLVEGIRLYRQISGAKLVVSGGRVYGSGADAEAMQAMAVALGVNTNDIVTDMVSQDTETQAQVIKQRVGTDKIILVTSASHMARSVGLFKQAGVDLIPAPTHYLVQTDSGFSPIDLFPDKNGPLKAERLVYEYLGIGWAHLRGRW